MTLVSLYGRVAYPSRDTFTSHSAFSVDAFDHCQLNVSFQSSSVVYGEGSNRLLEGSYCASIWDK
jgi:hypothetical protein